AGSPPALAARPVVRCLPGRMTRVAILHQEHSFQPPMPGAEGPQLPDVVSRVLRGLDRQLHPARVDDQEEQQVHGAVPGVLELLLLDGAGEGSPDRATLQTVEVGLLIDGPHPEALMGEPLCIRITPKDLLGPLRSPSPNPFWLRNRLASLGMVRLQALLSWTACLLFLSARAIRL